MATASFLSITENAYALCWRRKLRVKIIPQQTAWMAKEVPQGDSVDSAPTYHRCQLGMTEKVVFFSRLKLPPELFYIDENEVTSKLHIVLVCAVCDKLTVMRRDTKAASNFRLLPFLRFHVRATRVFTHEYNVTERPGNSLSSSFRRA